MALGIGASQQGTTSSGLSQATTAVTTAGAGSLIVAGEIYSRNTSTFSTLVDAKSNTYTLIGSQQNFDGANGAARLHYKENAIGGASHTATFTQTGTAGPIAAFMAEFTGVATLGALDTSAQTNDVSSPFTASVTPSAGRRILVALFAGNSGSNPATHAESSGFTILTNCNSTDGVNTWTGCVAYRIVTADGSTVFTASFTETGGADTAIVLAAFKEAAVGASIPKLSPGRSPGKFQFMRSRPAYPAAAAAAPSGDIAGTDGITFGQSGTLTGAGALAGSNGLTFGQSGALTGVGSLTGAASLTFGQTGSLAGTGALAGTSALIFGQTGALTASGALAGAAPLTFGQTGALTAAGALAGTTTITFGGTATADVPAGEISGTASLAFAGSGSLVGAGALNGTGGILFGGQATADGTVPGANGPVPAGRPTRRHRYYIEIDGQNFPVASLYEAETVLNRAKALALNHAQQAAEHIVSRGTQSGSKPIALPTPTIRSPNPELRDLIHETHEIINNVYRSTAIDAELAALLTRALAEQDEEDALLVLM